MKFKANDWLGTETMTIQYGIDALYEGVWHHCCEDGKPLFFDTAEERDKKLEELRKAS